MSYMIEAFI